MSFLLIYLQCKCFVNLSFRIGGDWSFDDDAANNYGATVRSFDPT